MSVSFSPRNIGILCPHQKLRMVHDTNCSVEVPKANRNQAKEAVLEARFVGEDKPRTRNKAICVASNLQRLPIKPFETHVDPSLLAQQQS